MPAKRQPRPSTASAPEGAPPAAAHPHDEPLLLVTEPGPARTILGRLMGYLGRHAHAPFLVVACGVLTPDLLEVDAIDPLDPANTAATSTAAGTRRPRLIEQARGGTLYLDGIDHLTPPQQEQLLLALPPRTAANGHDVKLLATISEPPAAAVQAGRLSPALLERFTVVDLRQAEPDADTTPPAAPDVTVRIGTPLADMEKAFILATLDHCDGDKRRTASMLGISLRTLYNRLHDWKIVEAWTHRSPSSDRAA